MEWTKLGRVFSATGQHIWLASHTQLPTADILEGQILRIYFASRFPDNRSVIASVDVNPDDPLRILRLSVEPVLGPGPLGAFDDSGVLPSCAVNHGERKYLFYIGVNTSTTVSGRTSIGVAVNSGAAGEFERLFAGPILERCAQEPYLCTAPWVIPGEPWRMWYVSGVGWDSQSEPRYHICYTESADGVRWMRPGRVAVEFLDGTEAGLGRPCVIRHQGLYRMWFCARGPEGYRTGGRGAYRIAYAESGDGIHWTRQPIQPGISRSAEGWDSEMIAYPNLFVHRTKLHMLYNGNGFGKTGFGIARLDEVHE